MVTPNTNTGNDSNGMRMHDMLHCQIIGPLSCQVMHGTSAPGNWTALQYEQQILPTAQ